MATSDDNEPSDHIPTLCTFTGRIPFFLGIPDELVHRVELFAAFADERESQLFGRRPWVNICIYNVEMPGLKIWPPGVTTAIEHFYGESLDEDPEATITTLKSYEQWVTLETPSGLLAGEDPADQAYALHRCAAAFNLFLRAAAIATGDMRIRFVSSQDFRPVIIVGEYPQKGPWRYVMPLFMHPDAMPESLPISQDLITQERLSAAMTSLQHSQPYLTTGLWRARAQRAQSFRGDAADAIVSYQVAAESLLFDTWRMLLVDLGYTASEIALEMGKEVPFRSLVARVLPQFLGGSWDVTNQQLAVGRYWNALYLVRNRVVHTGFDVHGGHVEEAAAAYLGLSGRFQKLLRESQLVWSRVSVHAVTSLR